MVVVTSNTFDQLVVAEIAQKLRSFARQRAYLGGHLEAPEGI